MDDKSALQSAAIRAEDGRMNPPHPRTSMSTAAAQAVSTTKIKTEIRRIALQKSRALISVAQCEFISKLGGEERCRGWQWHTQWHRQWHTQRHRQRELRTDFRLRFMKEEKEGSTTRDLRSSVEVYC